MSACGGAAGPGAALLARVAPRLAAAPGDTLGVAVSGGGDSLALLLLAEAWARGAGRRLAVVTVDHGLRAEAAAEAGAVARICAARGIPHAMLAWDGPAALAGGGNLQALARDARRGLIAGWAAGQGIAAVALAHTREDQAETFLLRLARGSGVDGLAAMAPVTPGEGLLWLRPLLDSGRDELRAFLRAAGVAWAEDPSNADPRFDRVRMRAALPGLAALGLGPGRLAATAAAMARARAALEAATADLAARAARPQPAGDLHLDPAALAAAPEELRLRVLAGSLAWVAGTRYRPRLAALEAAAAALATGRLGHGLTLHGCVLRPLRDGAVALRREPARAAPPVAAATGRWDNRWAIELPRGTAPNLTLGALGAGDLAAIPDWRGRGLPREVLLTTPALREGPRLVAAPLLGHGPALPCRRISPLTPPWAGALPMLWR